MNAIKNLKKAYQSKQITQDTHTLEKFLIKNEKDGKAVIDLVGIESKYIPQFDMNSPHWNGKAQGNGFRTRFLLSNGETIGTFSNGAHLFFEFYAQIMGYTGREEFLHIDINGNILVEISKIQLDQTRSTYNFELLEEGSTLNGFSEYLPTQDTIMQLEAPTEPAPAEPEQAIEEENKPTKKK